MTKKRTTRRWIHRAINRPGALRRQLRIPTDRPIPTELLRRIHDAQVGDTVRVHGRQIRVTHLLKRRATLALTLRRFRGKSR